MLYSHVGKVSSVKLFTSLASEEKITVIKQLTSLHAPLMKKTYQVMTESWATKRCNRLNKDSTRALPWLETFVRKNAGSSHFLVICQSD